MFLTCLFYFFLQIVVAICIMFPICLVGAVMGCNDKKTTAFAKWMAQAFLGTMAIYAVALWNPLGIHFG